MNQNQTLDNDLQRAIDDITNTTSVDPVFSDPVAAPSSVPEGDNGVMGEAVGPFPVPEPTMPNPTVTEESPVAATVPEVAPMPELNMQPHFEMPPMPMAPLPESEVKMPEPEMQKIEPVMKQQPMIAPEQHHNMKQVRESALRDLAPLLEKMSINPSQKFRIYRDMFEDLKDYTVLESAYQAAHEITDESERGEALLYLIEAIDHM